MSPPRSQPEEVIGSSSRSHDPCGFLDPLGFLSDSIDFVSSMSPQLYSALSPIRPPSKHAPPPPFEGCYVENPIPDSLQNSNVDPELLILDPRAPMTAYGSKEHPGLKGRSLLAYSPLPTSLSLSGAGPPSWAPLAVTS